MHRRTLGDGLLALFATLALAAGMIAGPLAAPAVADHESPDRTFTYDIDFRGTFTSHEMEHFRHMAFLTYADLRGWSLGGSVKLQAVDSGGDFTLWLSEPQHMESFSTACSPDWSCRVGDDVIVNEDNWDNGTDAWTRSLEEYRHMVINHETGHWLDDRLSGDHDLEHTDCPERGALAPVMMQQSIDLQGCVANPWPVMSERSALAGGLGVELHFGFGHKAALIPGTGQGYAVDGFGELHPFGVGDAPPPPAEAGPSFSFDIARDVALLPDGRGYVLDGWGGLHPFNGAPPADGGPYWRGRDIARSVMLLPDGSGGYVTDGWGGMHPFGVDGAAPPRPGDNPYWNGWDIANDAELLPDGSGGYVLDGWGGVHPFTVPGHDRPASASGGPYWEHWDIARDLAVMDEARGAFVLDGWGGIHGVALAGDVPAADGPRYWPGYDLARSIVVDVAQGLGRMHDVASNGLDFGVSS